MLRQDDKVEETVAKAIFLSEDDPMHDPELEWLMASEEVRADYRRRAKVVIVTLQRLAHSSPVTSL